MAETGAKGKAKAAASKETGGGIKDTDIIFECPFCRKSLAIDYRGAGLAIPCKGCGKTVTVPIPKGMELSDIDSSEEDKAALVMHLREALSGFQARVRVLEGMVEELKEQRSKQDVAAARTAERFVRIARDVEVVGKAVQDVSAAIARISQAVRPSS